jgi:hypothetical protein
MDKKFIEDAYRKLKGSVYLDKTVPFLRMRIVDYERGELEKKIDYIYEALHDEVKWERFRENILETIRVLTFPKKIEIKGKDVVEGEPIVISNISGTDVIIEKYNNFIDMSVEGHIIGILWILTIGYKLDNNLYQNCYGNRLNDKLVFDNQKTTASPSLFKPYFSQYENWRNQGLKRAESVVNDQKKSVIITMLDLTRYYYNIEITEQVFRDMTSMLYNDKNDVLNRLNYCIYDIIRTYSELCGCQNEYMLPIGFLPSSIISNYYLKNIDDKLEKSQGEVYYGRYVDDMILVTEIENTAVFKEKILKSGNQYVCDYMLDLLGSSDVLKTNNDGKYLLSDFPRLNFQKSKFRFFYIDKDGYDTIIGKIKDDICKNASEFNYIPETAIEELDADILKIEREDTVNKLRAINKTAIDKYALSKTVGKNIMMSKFAEGKTIIKFAKSLEQVLNHKEILSNYTLWESILNYYVINDYIEGIGYLTKAICSAIEHMDEEENKCDEYEYLKSSRIEQVGDSLIYYYLACLTRATAISWGRDIKQAIEESIAVVLNVKKYRQYIDLYTLKNINQTRKAYCNSRMINKSLLPVSIEDCMSAFKPDDLTDKGNLFSLKNYLESDLKCRFSKKNGRYAPYIQSPFEILYSVLINQIREGKEELFTDQKCVEILCKKYAENFSNPKGKYIKRYINADFYNEENDIVKIKSYKRNKNLKMKIAVANVKMEEGDIADILKGDTRDVSKRCREIGKILNEAIHYKADVLIFPEAYIPLEYLKILQAKVAKHNMVIIGGIEHIKHGNLVYNLTTTILPIKNKYMSYAIPFFHQKMYFSPHELKIVQKYGCKPAMGQKHTLFCWGNIYFVTYCCYELTSISLRHIFQGTADIVFGVEWNSDTYYFGNIMEALSRDIYCYCVQSNMSEYGDSRIIQPTKKDFMNILKVKGGINASVLIGEIDIQELRKHQRKKNDDSDKNIYKPLPAGWDFAKTDRK